MYSDEIVATDPRAQVMVGDFTDEPPRPGRGRGGGRGRRGRGVRRSEAASGRMDIDH